MVSVRNVPRPQEYAWLITGPLGLFTVLVALVLSTTQRTIYGEWLLGLLFLGLFALADLLVLMVQVRRQTFTITLVEIPFLLALFWLPPMTVILARVIASIIAQTSRHVPPVKLWFNVASNAASTALATLIVFSAHPLHVNDDERVGPYAWAVLAAAVTAMVLSTLATTAGVITLVQGRISTRDLIRIATPVTVVAGINITIGLITLVVLQQGVWSILLLAALATCFVAAYRSYSRFLRQHRTLSEIYDLTRSIADTPHDGTLIDILLHRVRGLLQAEYATLWLPALGRYPEILLSARVDDTGLVDLTRIPEAIRQRVRDTGTTIAVGHRLGTDELRAELREARAKDGIVVALRAGSAVIGCLEVANRLSDLDSFGESDVRLLETIAAHAAVAVENSRLVERLRHDAYHDSLTGLPNRRRITAAIDESVGVRAPGEQVAVLLFDVDGLRQVNESMGHSAGDQVLAEVGRRLRACAPPGALIGRLGSDEFAVTLRVESPDAAQAIAALMREQIRDEMVFGSLTLDVETAVGIVVHPDHGSDAALLLQRADLAATAAKTVPGSIQLFNAGLESRSVRRLALAGDLRRALDNDQIEVYFQPKVTLTDRRLLGVECLARWEHPAHGAVPPEDFVAVAEHTGQLARLTEAVLKEGLKRCRDWSATDHPLSISVNLSARTLIDADFPTRVQELLGEYGVAPHRLTFEIKEEGVLDGTDRPMPTLRRLRDIGVRLSVDDFGTGYSSLSYLRRLPVHEVKVDRSFVQGMATDPADLAIVNAVVTLSQQFGLTVVAEGVESELTLELLQDIGCEVGQGFLFSRPLPYERLEAWFSAQTESESTAAGEVRRLRAVT
ncbi:bifunctional diguanylate cyclase/phosphodiesterase [Asanoa ishikariensis]|uniref:Diguanylate cyclase/phosphodiesterase n=1 Tax=Asanoa ishikariensis TaxID=137265 RepID=A0A1H3LY33_9ACTN|nr:bifunctional diguanylate cyclase/phosphodiesterase [Asanoa ishikariensis]GIF65758.1 bifunctional diguanylate cyclase/phosphodiesterase [Asanoa ishikariensis]SDY68918.1 diguanylate cyclase/phosphodiesterase [Asanoa ishikariensis]